MPTPECTVSRTIQWPRTISLRVRFFAAAEYVHDTSFQADCQKVMRIIARKDKGEGVTYREISRFCHMKPAKLREILKYLSDSDDVSVTSGQHGADTFKLAA